MDVRLPDGTVIRGVPDGMSKAELTAKLKANGYDVAKLGGSAEPSRMQMLKDEALTSIPGGFARGLKDIVDTGARFASRLGGQEEAARIGAMNAAGKDEFSQAQQNVGAGASNVARVAGNIVGTLPVGGALAAPARALGMNRLAAALTTGGFRTGAAPTTLGGRVADMGIRMAGGAATGAVGAGLVDPESATTGAVVGAALPPLARIAGAGGNAASALVRPFFNSGQDRITGDALRKFASNPDEALRNLRNVTEIVPGSAPTAVAAAGDEGLAGLSRTLQSANPGYANELSARMSAQNAARTAALEEVAGNTGKLTLAREARDAATGAMRETVLDAAGKLPARPVLDSIDRLIAKPDNAGKMAQAALAEVRKRIADFAPDGQIDARALYAIRKDINDTLGGKLQGEAGNLKLASGQLIDVKGLIDKAIDQASRRVSMSAERGLMPFGANIERAGATGPYASYSPRPSWSGYLGKYADMSVPIDQMEKLEEVLKAISTGSVDKSGNAVLSAAKMNNYLRNNAKDLQKTLAPDQLELLRRLSADLNAGQLAATSGKAVGSNTVQNISGVNALTSLIGQRLGGSSPAQATAGRAINWLYKGPDEQIMNKLTSAMLDPQEAARLLSLPENSALLRAMTTEASRLGYRAAPALSGQ
jgi:hypothetical protein